MRITRFYREGEAKDTPRTYMEPSWTAMRCGESATLLMGPGPYMANFIGIPDDHRVRDVVTSFFLGMEATQHDAPQ